MQMMREGKDVPTMRAAIERKYSQYGPSTAR